MDPFSSERSKVLKSVVEVEKDWSSSSNESASDKAENSCPENSPRNRTNKLLTSKFGLDDEI